MPFQPARLTMNWKTEAELGESGPFRLNHAKEQWVVCYYYTDDEIYRKCAENLQRSLDKFGVKGYGKKISSTDWKGGVSYKPTFIRECLDMFDNVLYTDADSALTRGFDVRQDAPGEWLVGYAKSPWKEILSGTIFFRKDGRTINFVDEFIRVMNNEGIRQNLPCNWSLAQMVKAHPDICANVPSRYCKIFDLMKGVSDPVFVHYQASRVKRRGQDIGLLFDRIGYKENIKCLMGKLHKEKILSFIHRGSRVLEWGMGGTTIWLAQNLPSGATFISVEHSKQWYRLVEKKIGLIPNVRLLLKEPNGPVGKSATIGAENEASLHQYVHAVDGDMFDVIIVDGYARSACLKEAKKMLTKGGTVFLHDSQRSWYNQAKSMFIEKGNMGPCEDYPGPHLWWGENAPL